MSSFGRLRRAAAAATVAAIATIAVQVIGTGIASAHANAVTGISTCAADGTQTVQWSIANDYDSAETVAVTEHAPTDSSVNPVATTIAPTGTGQVTQTGVSGSATSADLTVRGTWSVDGFVLQNSGTVALDGNCRPTHVASAPTASPGGCTGGSATSGSITVPADAGVRYTLDGSPRSAGTYDVTAGPHEVVASSDSYQLSPPTVFRFDVVGPPGTCDRTVVPVAPRPVQAVCTSGSATPGLPGLTLPMTDGVVYSPSASAPYAQGQTVVVTATATAGHVFGPTAPTGWTHQDATHETYSVTFASITCTHEIAPQDPVAVRSSCSADGTPSAPTVTTAATSGITYTVSPVGTYTAGQSIVITATAAGSARFDRPTPSGWTYLDPTHETFALTFGAAPSCARAVAPMFTEATCSGNSAVTASYTIPSTVGVVYRVGTKVLQAGTYPAIAGVVVTVTAAARSGYTLTGPTMFVHTFAPTPTCGSAVMATPPTSQSHTCTGAGASGASYAIPSSVGVDYDIAGAQVAAGTYPASDGATVVVTATARDGYVLTGISTFILTFAAAPTCATGVNPVAPTFRDQVCDVGQTPQGASYTVPSTTGVEYLVDGAVVPAGARAVQSGTSVTVTARAASGYVLTGPAVFTHDFPLEVACIGAAVAVAPSFDPARCSDGAPALGSYSILATVGVDYYVRIVASGASSGSATPVLTSAGTYSAPRSGTVTVTARPQTGFTLVGSTTFTYSYTSAANCGSTLVPASAAFRDPVCLTSTTTSDPAYIIPTSIGAEYFVDGAQVGAGPHRWTGGPTVTVDARPANGYVLTGVTQWSHRFLSRPSCSGTDNVGASVPGITVSTGQTGSGPPALTGVPVALLLTGGVVFLLAGMSLMLLAGRRRPGRVPA